MAISRTSVPPVSHGSGATAARFGAGLTESHVRQLQTILREECGVILSLPEAWGRAIELLSLVEMLLQGSGILDHPDGGSSTGVRASSLLTDSAS